METLREKFAGDHNSYVMLIFDVWKDSEHTDRTQVRLPYMNIEDVVKKYGDFIYSGWYTEGWTEDGRWKASLWAMTADEKRSVDSWLYKNWPKLWERNDGN